MHIPGERSRAAGPPASGNSPTAKPHSCAGRHTRGPTPPRAAGCHEANSPAHPGSRTRSGPRVRLEATAPRAED